MASVEFQPIVFAEVEFGLGVGIQVSGCGSAPVSRFCISFVTGESKAPKSIAAPLETRTDAFASLVSFQTDVSGFSRFG